MQYTVSDQKPNKYWQLFSFTSCYRLVTKANHPLTSSILLRNARVLSTLYLIPGNGILEFVGCYRWDTWNCWICNKGQLGHLWNVFFKIHQVKQMALDSSKLIDFNMCDLRTGQYLLTIYYHSSHIGKEQTAYRTWSGSRCLPLLLFFIICFV